MNDRDSEIIAVQMMIPNGVGWQIIINLRIQK